MAPRRGVGLWPVEEIEQGVVAIDDDGGDY